MTIKASSFKDSNKGPGLADKLVPWYFVAFFTVITLVLGGFTYLALQTDPGLITRDAYKKGLDYDRIMAASDEGDILPWQADIQLKQENDMAVLLVRLRTGDKNIDNARVEAWLVRPAQDGLDQHWILAQDEIGQYRARGKLPQIGAWTVHVTVMVGNQQKQFMRQVVTS